MVYPLNLPEENKIYNAGLLIYRQKIIVELKQIVQKEAVGNKPNAKKLKEYFAALNYSYTLFILSKESQTLDFWKDKLNFTKIKDCYLKKDINLETLLTTMQNANN